MAGLFSCRAFVSFGPSRCDPSAEPPPLCRAEGKKKAELRLRVREQCPRLPGVYGMVDEHGELIYVGKAKSLRSRLLSYFRPRSRDPKAGRILRWTGSIVWEQCPSEFAALLRELELIRRWRPRFNVQGQPSRRRRAFVCLGRRPAPYLFLTRSPPAGALASYGPVPAGRQARESLRRLNDWFRLRDCPQSQQMHFADQEDLFPAVRAAGCIRLEIATCLGPCAGACSRSAYAEQTRSARAFLEGSDQTPLKTLECDMAKAAAAQEFERAAILRDKFTALRWLSDQLERLRLAREQFSFVYPVPAPRPLWYLIHCGRVARVVPAPCDAASCQAAADAVAAVYRGKGVRLAASALDDVQVVLLVLAWFRRHPEERAKVLAADEALAACLGPAPHDAL